jgi:hypothetical protein
MIELIVLAVIIAVAVGLLLVGLLGPILSSLNVPVATTVGGFFSQYGWVIGVLAGLWYFFSNGKFLG